jgi:hypothetical protein
MSSGPPNKRIKKITNRYKTAESNFFSSKCVDAANPKRPTTMEKSSSLKALKRDLTKLQRSDYNGTTTYTGFQMTLIH